MEGNNVNLSNFNYFPMTKEINENYTLAEYIWVDGSGKTLRSKTKTYNKKITKLEDLEWWTYDGSSCEQAPTHDSEIWMKPVYFCPDPFRGNPHILVVSESYKSDKKTPALGNFRTVASKVFKDAEPEDPWFGIEQEYFLMAKNGTVGDWPLGWPKGGYPQPQLQYYCSAGEGNAFGRAVTEAHIRACLYAGIKIAGLNAEVAAGQWEYQCGICKGIEIGDHMLLSRYILQRIAESFGVGINLEPKPVKGDWNGSGCHTNYSTKSTREEGGLKVMTDNHLVKMKEKHKEHIMVYGEGNNQRLTGIHETAKISEFSYKEGHRGASVRIPVSTMEQGKGYYEDRRPASNIDAYLVCAMIADTTILNSKYCNEITSAYKEYAKARGYGLESDF